MEYTIVGYISTVPSCFVVSRGACLILLQLVSCSIRVATESNKRRELRQSSSGPSIWTILFHMSRNEMVLRFSIEKQGLTRHSHTTGEFYGNHTASILHSQFQKKIVRKLAIRCGLRTKSRFVRNHMTC